MYSVQCTVYVSCKARYKMFRAVVQVVVPVSSCRNPLQSSKRHLLAAIVPWRPPVFRSLTTHMVRPSSIICSPYLGCPVIVCLSSSTLSSIVCLPSVRRPSSFRHLPSVRRSFVRASSIVLPSSVVLPSQICRFRQHHAAPSSHPQLLFAR